MRYFYLKAWARDEVEARQLARMMGGFEAYALGRRVYWWIWAHDLGEAVRQSAALAGQRLIAERIWDIPEETWIAGNNWFERRRCEKAA